MQDVHLARAELASAEEALRQTRGGYDQAQRSLEVLLGRYPGAELEGGDAQLAVPPPIPAGVPADILARRADLIAAERRVAAAFYQSEEARLAKLPSFSLTGVLGGSTDLSDGIASLGAGLVAPLYTGGALEGQIDAANADQRAAVALYGQALLTAFKEVETSLLNEKLLAEREGFLATVIAENEQALEIANAQYEVGKTDLLSVLQIQAKVIAARIGIVNLRQQRLANRVTLHLALGGSFTDDR
jgi:outer membrane protein TolC